MLSAILLVFEHWQNCGRNSSNWFTCPYFEGNFQHFKNPMVLAIGLEHLSQERMAFQKFQG